MSYIYVSFDTVDQLIEQLQKGNYSLVRSTQTDPTPNFVLIVPDRYYGTYGGLIFNSILQNYSPQKYVSHSIDQNVSVVWWHSPGSGPVGDCALTVEGGRVAITPLMFRNIFPNYGLKKKTFERSSYFGDRAWRMNSRSFSNSDSS